MLVMTVARPGGVWAFVREGGGTPELYIAASNPDRLRRRALLAFRTRMYIVSTRFGVFLFSASLRGTAMTIGLYTNATSTGHGLLKSSDTHTIKGQGLLRLVLIVSPDPYV